MILLQRVATMVMTAKGYPNLLNMHGSKLHYQNTGLTVKKRLCCRNPKVVDGFIRATIEA